MRFSIDPEIYGGYDPFAVFPEHIGLQVILNGEENTKCVAADDVTGEAWVYKTSDLPGDSELRVEKINCTVEFRLYNG